MIFAQRLFATAGLAGMAAAAVAQTPPSATPAAPATAPSGTTAQPAATSAAGKVAVGATVLDTSGGQVGTVKSVDVSSAVVATGAHEVKLPLTSFAAGPNGPIIAMTKAQLDASASQATAQAQADLPSKLTVGSKIVGPQGSPVGTVEANDGQFVTVATAKSKARLPMSAFASGPNGAVIGLTEAQLDAAAAQAAPSGG